MTQKVGTCHGEHAQTRFWLPWFLFLFERLTLIRSAGKLAVHPYLQPGSVYSRRSELKLFRRIKVTLGSQPSISCHVGPLLSKSWHELSFRSHLFRSQLFKPLPLERRVTNQTPGPQCTVPSKILAGAFSGSALVRQTQNWPPERSTRVSGGGPPGASHCVELPVSLQARDLNGTVLRKTGPGTGKCGPCFIIFYRSVSKSESEKPPFLMSEMETKGKTKRFGGSVF